MAGLTVGLGFRRRIASFKAKGGLYHQRYHAQFQPVQTNGAIA